MSPGPCCQRCERGLEVVGSRADYSVLRHGGVGLLFNVLHHTRIPAWVFGAAPGGSLSVSADHADSTIFTAGYQSPLMGALLGKLTRN